MAVAKTIEAEDDDALGAALDQKAAGIAPVIVDDKPEGQKPEAGERKFTDEDFAKLAKTAKDAQDAAKAYEAAHRTTVKERDELKGQLASEVEAKFQAEENSVTQGIAAASSDADRYKKEAARAMEEGRWEDAAEANAKGAEARLQVSQYNQYQTRLKAAKTQAETEAKQRASDPLAALPQNARDWITRHPQFMSDAGYNRRVRAYCDLAETEGGHAPFSDGYFRFVEEKLGERQAARQNGADGHEAEDDEGDTEAPVVPQQRRATQNQDIPVTRRAPGKPPVNGQVHLTADEREHAEMTMPTAVRSNPKEYQAWLRNYANERDRLRAEGQL